MLAVTSGLKASNRPSPSVKSEGPLSLLLTYALLEERIVIDSGSHDFLVRPAFEDAHRGGLYTRRARASRAK